jgi:hypothetical protein
MQGKADETECPRSLAGRHRRQRKSDQVQNLSGTNEVARREVMVGVKPVMPTDARLEQQELSCAQPARKAG